MVGQEHNKNIIKLQCPTEVTRKAEGSNSHTYTSDMKLSFVLMFVHLLLDTVLHSQGPSVPEDRS